MGWNVEEGMPDQASSSPGFCNSFKAFFSVSLYDYQFN